MIVGDRQYLDFVHLIDSANDGDTYDYSPLEGDTELSLKLETAKVYKDSLQETLVVYGKAQLPKDLKDRLSENPKWKKYLMKYRSVWEKVKSLKAHSKFIILFTRIVCA